MKASPRKKKNLRHNARRTWQMRSFLRWPWYAAALLLLLTATDTLAKDRKQNGPKGTFFRGGDREGAISAESARVRSASGPHRRLGSGPRSDQENAEYRCPDFHEKVEYCNMSTFPKSSYMWDFMPCEHGCYRGYLDQYVRAMVALPNPLPFGRSMLLLTDSIPPLPDPTSPCPACASRDGAARSVVCVLPTISATRWPARGRQLVVRKGSD
jgi:hypothetical protein